MCLSLIHSSLPVGPAMQRTQLIQKTFAPHFKRLNDVLSRIRLGFASANEALRISTAPTTPRPGRLPQPILFSGPARPSVAYFSQLAATGIELNANRLMTFPPGAIKKVQSGETPVFKLPEPVVFEGRAKRSSTSWLHREGWIDCQSYAEVPRLHFRILYRV
ncbi:uncharacterized protein LAESUDRAFT_732357 [Laetiporus sulphureus 93-53]|uniref:Uncharacterized protein n=1 Tax=Laetiporus sulphureus 93-53 TaxID=1314785 RepID=A0A165B6B7_9APHY|nr:uncharacterized protein LAESUDRAFT_732357 [Laetiporus sulphureus 93-53]KZT00340.1 hypothetical protein LAESUDRAFT_732357 [Laetiporus sulphureus 93-53]